MPLPPVPTLARPRTSPGRVVAASPIPNRPAAPTLKAPTLTAVPPVIPEAVLRDPGSEEYPFANVTPVYLEIPTHAVRLRPMPAPPGAPESYVNRFNAAVADWLIAPMWYTPSQAAHIMEFHNGRNRPMSAAWKKLQNKIDGGVWYMNAETVVFGSDGHLLNGQHRMKGTAHGSVPVPMLVVFNVNPNVFTTLDQGTKRGPGDILATHGHDYAKLLAATLGWVLRYEKGGIRGAWETVPNEIVEDMLLAHPGVLKAIERVKKTGWNKSKLYPQSLLSFLYYELAQIDAPAAERFFEKVVEGVGIARDSHEFLLRRWLESNAGINHISNYIAMAAVTFKTWLNIRAGKEPGGQISWRQSETFPSKEALAATTGAARLVGTAAAKRDA